VPSHIVKFGLSLMKTCYGRCEAMYLLIKAPFRYSTTCVVLLWACFTSINIGFAADNTLQSTVGAAAKEARDKTDANASAQLPEPTSTTVMPFSSLTVAPSDKALEIKEGESLAFRLKVFHRESAIRGVEWYGNGDEPYVQRTYEDGFEGSQRHASFLREHTFENPGKHKIVALVFDSNNTYFETNSWMINVIGPTENTFLNTPSENTIRIEDGNKVTFTVKATNKDGVIRRVEWNSLGDTPDSAQYADGKNIIILTKNDSFVETQLENILTVKKGEKIAFSLKTINANKPTEISLRKYTINGPADEISPYRAFFERNYEFIESGVHTITVLIFDHNSTLLHKATWKVIVGKPYFIPEILFGIEHLGYLGAAVVVLIALIMLFCLWIFRKDDLR